LSVTLFEKEPIYEVLTNTHPQIYDPCPPNQLSLFKF
jgi:hypothetical protein